MNRLISWLSKRKKISFLISIAYLTAISLGHLKVSGFFDWLKEQLTFGVYDSMMRDLGAVLLLLLSLVLLHHIRKDKRRRTMGIVWWLFTAGLIVGSYEALIVFSVETIHFVQYALLAIPVFALTMSFGETVGWVTLMGALDEAYQYFVLYAGNRTVYLDFNDIILNLVGAGTGVLMIYTLADIESAPLTLRARSLKRRLVSPWALTTISVIMAGLALHLSGIVELYPEASAASAPVVLSRKLPPFRFWLRPDVGKSFHILTPAQGILVAIVLTGVYSLMDFRFAGGPHEGGTGRKTE
ncbi:MAG: hypothetical protein P8013_05805 [Candidatus Sulfobium sp.]|jgi:hypothetical protein